MSKSVLKYIVSIVLVGFSIYMICQEKYLSLLKDITFLDLMVAILITFFLKLIAGFNMRYFLSKYYDIKLSIIDMMTLQLMMSFWGFLIPIRGGMIYSVLFLKSKYKLLIAKSTSMAIFLYSISFTLMGVFGVYYVFSKDIFLSPVTAISIALIFNPFLLRWVNYLFQKFNLSQISLMVKIQELAHKIILDSRTPWKDYQTTFIVSGMLILRFLLLSLRYYWAARVFNLEVSYLSIMILTVVTEFSNIVFKILPGNMGFTEMIAGGVFGLLGEGTQEGLLVALFIRFATLSLTFTVGTYSVVLNLKYFQVSNIKSLWEKMKSA